MTSKCSTFSPHAGTAAVGLWMRHQGIWEIVAEQVKIKQKTLQHKPQEKMLDALINMLAGGERMVEVNTRVRADRGLQAAFGRQGCAEQSGVSTTFDRCTTENVDQMQAALRQIYRRHSQGYRHKYRQGRQVLDVDMSGLLSGRQAEGASKGYFAQKRGGAAGN